MQSIGHSLVCAVHYGDDCLFYLPVIVLVFMEPLTYFKSPACSELASGIVMYHPELSKTILEFQKSSLV
jgi:hypothetical protein